MFHKIIKYLSNIFGACLILTGCALMWTKYPTTAIGIILTGISLLPVFYLRLQLKRRIWRWIIPIICLSVVGISLWPMPRKQVPPSEYVGKDPTFVYIGNNEKFYHYNPNCAGKNPRRTRLSYVTDQQIKPCQRCCDN